jgi:hypothetical protein
MYFILFYFILFYFVEQLIVKFILLFMRINVAKANLII